MADEQSSFPIDVYSGLIRGKHRAAMGAAVWEYLWCLDHQTELDGSVLGGRPVTLEEIGKDLDTHPKTVGLNLRKLASKQYVEVTRTQYGLVLRVLKAKKYLRRCNKTVTSEPDRGNDTIPSEVPRSNETTTSEPPRGSETTPSAEPQKERKRYRRRNETVTSHSYSDITLDPTQLTTTPEARECLAILETVPGYRFDLARDLEMIAEYARDFPTLVLTEEIRQWKAYKRDHPLSEKSSPRSQLRTWLRKSVEFARKSSRKGAENHGVGRTAQGNRKPDYDDPRI